MNTTTEKEIMLETMHGTPAVYGTLYCNVPTLLGDIFQTILAYEAHHKYRYTSDLPFSYSNVMGLLQDYMTRRNWETDPAYHVTPLVRDDKTYCGRYSEWNKLAWMSTLDLQIHDAAVSYTYMAARDEDSHKREIYAGIACDLWFYSRQLRRDYADETGKKTGHNGVVSGQTLAWSDIIPMFKGFIHWQFMVNIRYNSRFSKLFNLIGNVRSFVRKHISNKH